MNTKVLRSISTLGWCGLWALAAGCATGSGGTDRELLLMPGEESPAFFSDDASMRQVEQSRDLLALQEQEYLVGPDDVLEISIFEWEANEQTKTLKFRVSETGFISLPVVGPLQVMGKSIHEVQQMIEQALVSQNVLQTPRVGIWISEFRSRQISVIGAVNQPGSYAIHQNVSTLLNMLTLAGGPQDSAGAVAYIIRGDSTEGEKSRIRVDLSRLLESGDPSSNPVLSAGDVVFVPKAPLIYVYGAVRQPGGFTFRKQLRVLEAVALAGGVSDMANRRSLSLIRRSEGGDERLFELDLALMEKGKAPNIYLRDGDVLHIRVSGPKAFGMEMWSFIRGIFTFSYRLN